MVVGVGSGGTITGLSRAFERLLPACELILADPKGSVLAGYLETGLIGEAGSWIVEGIGEDFLPPILDLHRVRRAYTIDDREALSTVRELLRQEGLLSGTSSGVLIAAALRYCRAQTSPKRVCTFVCDSGSKYLSKAFNDAWLLDHGFLERPRFGDLRDLITRRFADGAVVTVAPDDTLLIALARMKLYEISQLPVLEPSGALVGLIDESDLLVAGVNDSANLKRPVREVMSTRLRTVDVQTPIAALMPLFDQGFVPIVLEGSTFIGLITRMDLLTALRRRLS